MGEHDGRGLGLEERTCGFGVIKRWEMVRELGTDEKPDENTVWDLGVRVQFAMAKQTFLYCTPLRRIA